MDYSYQKILLIGECGNGQSSLGNYFLGQNLFKESNEFLNGTTKIEIGTGKFCQIQVQIFDSPGLDDPNGNDQQILDSLVETMLKEGTIHGIILCINFNKPRLTQKLETILETYFTMLNQDDIFRNLSICFTNYYTQMSDTLKPLKEARTTNIMEIFQQIHKRVYGVTGFNPQVICIDTKDATNESINELKIWLSGLSAITLKPQPVVDSVKEIQTENRTITTGSETRVIGQQEHVHYGGRRFGFAGPRSQSYTYTPIMKTFTKKAAQVRDVKIFYSGLIQYSDWLTTSNYEE